MAKTSKYEIKSTNKFKKDLKKMRSRKEYDEESLIKVIEILSNDDVLPEKYHNHLLEPKNKRIMGMSYKTRLVTNISKK